MHILLPLALPAAPGSPSDTAVDAAVDEAAAVLTDVGGTALRVVVTIIGGIVVALLLRHLVHKLTRRLVTASGPMVAFGRVATRTANVSFGGPLVERREQRADTLASVLDSAVTVVVGSAVVLLVMKDLGWDIAPLLTSVGIVGVALAFGAQSLVKDVLSGIFMLLEDQYGIGDVIDLATTTGTVESVGLRVTRVRDSDGTLWFYRNGEIARVGNQSQGWSRAVVDVRLAAAADLRRTRELLVETGARVAADPEYRDLTVGEPTVTFVDDPTTSGAQLRLTVKTAPGEQSEVATELRRRVRLALAEAGVPLAS